MGMQDVLIVDSASWMCAVYASRFVKNRSDRIHLMEIIEKSADYIDTYDLLYFVPRKFGLQAEPGRFHASEGEGIYFDNLIKWYAELFMINLIELPEDPDKWVSVITKGITEKLKENSDAYLPALPR